MSDLVGNPEDRFSRIAAKCMLSSENDQSVEDHGIYF